MKMNTKKKDGSNSLLMFAKMKQNSLNINILKNNKSSFAPEEV